MKKAFLSLIILFAFFVSGSAQITVFPHEEDFEGTSTCPTLCGNPCNLTSSWKNTGGDDIDWTADNGGTTSGSTGPTTDHKPGTAQGIYVYTEASGCASDDAFLISPVYDFTNVQSLALEFWYHMYGQSMGSMSVDARVAGGSWVNNITPSRSGDQGNSWQKWTIDLPQYEGVSDVQFRIRGRTGTSFWSDMAVDDIYVGSIFDNDLSIRDVISPVQDCNFSGTHPVELRIRNLGLQSQSAFSLAYQVNDRAPVVENYSGTVNPDQTITYTFNQSASFNGDSNFVFKTWIIFPADENKINDSAMIGLKTIMPWGRISFKGFDNRGVGQAVPGWNEGLGNNPNMAISDWTGSDSLQTIFYNTTTARVNIKGTGISDWLLTPSFKVTRPSRLYFSTAVTTHDGTTTASMGSDDMVKARVSTDCGTSWTDLLTFNASSGQTNQFDDQLLILDPYVGQEIIIGFQALSGSNDPEDYDFHIGVPEARFVYPNDVGISSWSLGNGGTSMPAGSGEIVYYTIKNFGSNGVPNIPVIAQIGNSNYQHIQYQTLAANNEIEIQAGGYWAYSNGPARVPVKIYTLLNGDTINTNDTLNSFITVLGIAGVENGLDKDELRIFPNPNRGSFQLDFANSQDYSSIRVMDRTGKTILQQELVDNLSGVLLNLSGSGLRPGVYFLVLEGDSRSQVAKLILE